MLRLLFLVSMIVCLLASAVRASADPSSDKLGKQTKESFANRRIEGALKCSSCTQCSSDNSKLSLPFREFPFIACAASLLVLLLVRKNKAKALFWTLGLLLFFGLSISQAKRDPNMLHSAAVPEQKLRAETPQKEETKTTASATPSEALDEFEPVAGNPTFETVSSDASASVDEFAPLNQTAKASSPSILSAGERKNLGRTLLALLAAVFSGLAFRYWRKKVLRYLLLLSSLVYLGFYSGGCPCMISSFQNVVLLLLGEPVQWLSLIWVLALLPITYFFGKVWCGWVCHLGAFQEFLFRPELAKKVQTPTLQKVFSAVRLTAFLALIAQLVVTRSNLFITIDPFKVAFNLFSANLTSYLLLALLLGSSLLIYRPFCKAFCPVGLILGWVGKIPYSSKLQIESSCKSCKQCKKQCHHQAVNEEAGVFSIANHNCIRCGDCVETCKFASIQLNRKQSDKQLPPQMPKRNGVPVIMEN